jgi:hypothetical protein
MARKPESPQSISWSIYRAAHKAIWIGEVEARPMKLLRSRRRLRSSSCRRRS